MAAVPTKLLIFGATGVIGKYIIEEICNARSSFKQIGLFTSESTAKNKADEIDGYRKKGVEIIVGNVDSAEDVTNAYKGYDTVISALGRNAILAQIPLVELANASPTIKFFYPSEYGTDIEYNASSVAEKPHQLKLQVREYIRKNTTNLKVTYLVTGPYSDLFFGSTSEKRAGSFDVPDRKATLLGTGDEKISFTTMKDVGRLAVAALCTPVDASERVLKVNSFTVTSRQILAEFEKQTGGGKWQVEYTPLDELKEAEKEAWEVDSGFKTVYTLRRIWIEGKTLYDQRDNGKIGFGDGEGETLEEQVSKAIEKQK